VSNVADLMKKKAEKKVAVEQEQEAMAIEVEGDMPEKIARVGDIVLLTWGDPNMIGTPMFDVALVVTLADPKTGRLNGQMITDPTMQGMDPRSGRPVPIPSVVPVANVPFSATQRPMTWRHRD